MSRCGHIDILMLLSHKPIILHLSKTRNVKVTLLALSLHYAVGLFEAGTEYFAFFNQNIYISFQN